MNFGLFFVFVLLRLFVVDKIIEVRIQNFEKEMGKYPQQKKQMELEVVCRVSVQVQKSKHTKQRKIL